MKDEIEIKPIQKSLAKAISTFIARFVAFAKQYDAYFDYLANKYTEDDLHIDHIDLQNLNHIDNIVEIITLHQKEEKENKHDKSLYPAEMYAQLSIWGREAIEIRIFILQKHIESNLVEIKSCKDAVSYAIKKVGKYVKDPVLRKLIAKREDFVRLLEDENTLYRLQITTLKFALM
jgi:hypothetical protein